MKIVNVKEEENMGVKDEGIKRKRECYLSMLNWIVNVAKDPCNPAIGSLPDRHKWKHYGDELPWKQIISVREAMLLKTNIDATSQHSHWQKKQRMHPSNYDALGSDRPRYSQRLITAKNSSQKSQERHGSDSSSSNSDKDNDSSIDSAGFWFNTRRKKRVPLGSDYQVNVEEFNAENYQSDNSKWLGTQIWPLDKKETIRSLIERDPIGKGRQSSCGCQFPSSPECVKFHIREKRIKLKLELGSAFYKWGIDKMGEEVALIWTKEDEKKFAEVVKSNRLSSNKYFWDELFKNFPSKGREALVSYYFNVFLFRRRSEQNRNSTGNIDSDDEDSEFGPIGTRFGQTADISPGSIFRSPKKSNLNSG